MGKPCCFEETYVKDVCKEEVTAKKNGKSHIVSEEEKEDEQLKMLTKISVELWKKKK